MKIQLLSLLGAACLAPVCSYAVGDPDFERTKAGELPLWSGAQWAKSSSAKYSAKVVEDAKSAAHGKHFLRIQTEQKRAVWVMAYPSVQFIDGFGFEMTVKVRGKGKFNVGFNVYGTNDKIRPWRPANNTPYKPIDTDQWQTVRFRYVPIKGDGKFMVCFGAINGTLDFDAVDLKMVKLTAEEAAKAAAVPRKKVRKPAPEKAVSQAPKTGKYLIYSDFEKWRGGLPERWIRPENDSSSVIRRMILGENDADRFGASALYLNGRIIMDPPMRDLAVPRSRPMRLSFFAKGKNGKIYARLREGRNGHVDYLVDLVRENTTSEWKKYATAFALPPACRIDNAAIELIGENVVVDNLEFKAASGGDGKLEYAIPMVKKAPRIDGVSAPGEWDFATGGSDPLQLASYLNFNHAKPESPALSQQNTVRFCADGKKLYFMFEVPAGAGLRRDFTKRDDHIYLDDAVELHINPEFGNESPRYSYQFVFNANNAVFDQRREKGGGDVKFYKWNSKTLVNKSTVANGVWTLEGSVDLAEVGIKPDKPFGLNVCAAKRNPDEAGSLNGATFLWLGFMPKATVSSRKPGIYWSKNGDWGSMLVSLSNAAAPAGSYNVTYKLNSEKAAVTRKQSVYLAPGRTVPVLFNVPGGAGLFGTLEMTVTDRNNKQVFRQTMDFNSSIAPRRSIKKNLEFHFLPEQKKFAVNIHKAGGWADRVAKVEVLGVAEKPIILKPQDFTDFAGTLVVKKPFKTVDGKKYSISVLALDKDNALLETESFIFTANDALLPKDHSNDFPGVLPFYDPIKARGSRADVKLRTYTFDGNGLPRKILANGEEVLHQPARFTAVDANGKVLKGKNGKFRVISSNGQKMKFTGQTRFPGFTVELEGTLEYDGAIFYKGHIVAPRPVKLQRLSVELPMNKLDYFHSFVDSQLRLWMCRQPGKNEYRHPSVKVWTPDTIQFYNDYRRFTLLFFPYGDGVIWNSRNIIPGVIKNGFLPYLTAGNHKFGLEFFADTDRGWVHNKQSAIHEILRVKGKEIMRTNFIAMPWKLEGRRSFEFGIMATPGKHKRRDFRNGYINGYSHTGLTDQALAGLRVKDWDLYAKQIERLKKFRPIQLCCKGFYPQMDPVALYMDSDWRTRPDYVFRDAYAAVSGRVFGTDQRYYFSPAGCYTPGRLNFYTERFEEFAAKAPALQGFYWDENWMKPCNNPNHAECGYIMPDGQLQGRAWWTAIREVDRRAQHIFMKHGRKDPLLQGFTGEGIIPHAHSFVSVNLYGEHFTYDMDFIDYWTPHFTEIAHAGAWGFDVGGFGMFRDPKYLKVVHLNRAQLALFKLYDSNFLAENFNRAIYRPVEEAEKRFGKNQPDVVFAGYFSDEGKMAAPGLPVEVKASFFIRPGKGALVFICNLSKKTQTLPLKFNLKKWNLRQFDAFNAETRKPIDLSQKVTIKTHDFLMLELKEK